jgi:hypothetical protein
MGSALPVQRALPSSEQEEAEGKRIPEDDETVGAKLKGAARPLTPDHEREIVGRRGGQPLSGSERAFFEPRLAHDFGRVRIHAGAEAAASASALNARAYTYRNNIVFGSGEFAPRTSSGRWLLAHELAHVTQQARGLSSAVQRDLATPAPKTAPPKQPDLSESDVKKAIRFNRRRYNAVGTRLIQDLVGTKPTGKWVKADILAIARIQEAYGLKKDGKVGFNTFRFLDKEVRHEALPKTDKYCLTSLRIRKKPQNIAAQANGATMTRQFFMEAQFPAYCNCADYEYRQFIKGHLTHQRKGVVTDEGDWFANLPQGRIKNTWQEDGHTKAKALNYGHRNQPAESINRYLDDKGNVDMAKGCRYKGEDTPGGQYNGWHVAKPTSGDIIDIEVSFRGEIQRKGRVVRRKYWNALRSRFTLP